MDDKDLADRELVDMAGKAVTGKAAVVDRELDRLECMKPSW